MKYPIKLIPAALLGGCLMAASASAQLTLVGPGVNNGDFNDNSLSAAPGIRSYADTLFWDKLDTGTYFDATTDVVIGGLTSRNLNVRQQTILSIAAGDTGYTIGAGDVFDLSYRWVDGSGWQDGADEISIRLFTTDTDLITGAVSYIATANSGVKGATSTPTSQFVIQNGFYTATALDAGKNLFVAITSLNPVTGNASDNNAFARVDDFVLQVTAIPEPSTAALLIGAIAGRVLRRRR